MRVLVLVQSAVVGDARVVKQARSLADAGHTITVVGRGVPEDWRSVEDLAGITVLDAGRAAGLGSARSAGAGKTRDLAREPFWRKARRRVLRGGRWLLLPEHRARVEEAWCRSAAVVVARELESGGTRPVDAVHAHDLNTLALAAEIARRWGVPYVYDAHELWSDRGLPGRPTPWRTRRRTAQETQLARGAACVLTVSDGIADVLRGRGIADVRVVRNSFPPREPVTPLPASPSNLVYAGRIGPGRDLHTLVSACADERVPGVYLLGPVDEDFVAGLDLPAGVHRDEPAGVDEVDEVYRRHGAAAITLRSGPRNHDLALPNKLFHAVRAGVPVVAADLPELRRVVRRHDLGELYTPGDAASLAAATGRLVARYPQLLLSVAAARDELGWDRDSAVLTAVYARLVPGVTR